MEQFLNAETLIIELLLIVSLVALAVRRLNVPYTVALVVAGLVVTLQQPLELELLPEVILALFVPPLVFEAAFHLSLDELRRNLASLLVLAVPGVVLTMLIVGGALSVLTPLSWPLALVFGALIAATDPVAVVAIFRTLGVPKRLTVLLEGESLLNDGTAIVLFNLALVVALTGQLNPVTGLLDFAWVALGGAFIGGLLGWIVARLIARIDDYLIEITLTTVLAFGAYLVAERLGFSGVLAVVAAGLVNGNLGPQGMSPTTRIVLFNFWEYISFLANSLVFLLIGLQINLAILLNAWQPILWAILAVLLARVLVVYGFGLLARRLGDPVPVRWQHVLAWGGMRGAISLALALSLPAALGPERETLRIMAYGVVLFTLLVQGTTMGPLLRYLRLRTRSPQQLAYEQQHARLTAARAAEKHLDNLHREGLLSSHAWEQVQPALAQRTTALHGTLRRILKDEPALEAEELDTAWREVLRAERSALLGLKRDGIVSDDVYEGLTAEVDAALQHPLIRGLASDTQTVIAAGDDEGATADLGEASAERLDQDAGRRQP
jgi:CPA1 family monovalent cation:H+ antiporter